MFEVLDVDFFQHCILFPLGLVLCVLCLTVMGNYLLNAFAICVGEAFVFSLKVIVFVCLLVTPCIVCQRVFVLCL